MLLPLRLLRIAKPTSAAGAGARIRPITPLEAKGKQDHQFVFARSTSIGLEQPFRGTRVLPPGACPLNNAAEPTCTDITTIPLPEQFFAGGGNSHRGFGLNQAGPRDPVFRFSGWRYGAVRQQPGAALSSDSLCPILGEGFGFAIFHDMGNVFTAPHDMLKGLLRWHQARSPTVLVRWYNELPVLYPIQQLRV